jgi:hypothetical protein
MWGFSNFPIAVNYVNKYEQEVTMMNGKFHLSGGDFGSIRNIKAAGVRVLPALAHGGGVASEQSSTRTPDRCLCYKRIVGLQCG